MKANKGSSAGGPVMTEDVTDDQGDSRPTASVPLEEHHGELAAINANQGLLVVFPHPTWQVRKGKGMRLNTGALKRSKLRPHQGMQSRSSPTSHFAGTDEVSLLMERTWKNAEKNTWLHGEISSLYRSDPFTLYPFRREYDRILESDHQPNSGEPRWVWFDTPPAKSATSPCEEHKY